MGQKNNKKSLKKKCGWKVKTSCGGSCLWALVWPSTKMPLKYGTEFYLIVFRIFNRVVFPYDFWKKKFFWKFLGTSSYVSKSLLSVFPWITVLDESYDSLPNHMIRTESRIISAYVIRDSVKREFQIRFVIRDSVWRDFRIRFMIRIRVKHQL